MSDLLERDQVETGVWMRVADLAKDRGVARQSMSERVRKLQAAGHITTRKEGRFVLVNVPEFDLAINRHGNGFAEQRAEARQDIEDTVSPELRKSQAKKAEYDAEMARLKFEKEQSKVRGVSEIEDAGTKAAMAIIRELEKLPSKAGEIHKHSKNNNINATRKILKNMTDEIRKNLCLCLEGLAEKQKEN